MPDRQTKQYSASENEGSIYMPWLIKGASSYRCLVAREGDIAAKQLEEVDLILGITSYLKRSLCSSMSHLHPGVIWSDQSIPSLSQMPNSLLFNKLCLDRRVSPFNSMLSSTAEVSWRQQSPSISVH